MTKFIKTIFAALLILNWSVIAEGQPGSQNGPRDELRVMCFNIRYSAAGDTIENGWPNRKARVVATIRQFDPDLLGLQEVLADQYDSLRDLLPDYTAVGVARDDGARDGEWSAIFYRTARLAPLDSGTFWLSENPDEVGSSSWDAACVRICTWVKLRDRATGMQLLHANTHFDHRSGLARIGSAMLLNTRLRALAGDAPVILTGDFNATEKSETYKILVNSTKVGASQFLDAYREVHPQPSGDEATFHAFKGIKAGSRIDWILHTGQFKPISAEIVRSAAPPFPSDHYPVTAVLVRTADGTPAPRE